uniref:Dynein axonemal light chain 1 n=1 Tax=Pinguiococcus pyrenoidosus TaxID=172671 RepID=A0A7R9YAX7_9STRA
MTSIAAALKKWESKNEGVEIAQATEVKLYCQIPPIQRMDATLAGLSSVEHLSLSTNQIDRISGLRGLECLRTLSLGRNNIRSLAGLDDVAETLEQLWVSYNQISSLDGLQSLSKLETLYMSNNSLSWDELDKLKDLPCLQNVVFKGSLPTDGMDEAQYRVEILKRLPGLAKIDGAMVTPDELSLAQAPAE